MIGGTSTSFPRRRSVGGAQGSWSLGSEGPLATYARQVDSELRRRFSAVSGDVTPNANSAGYLDDASFALHIASVQRDSDQARIGVVAVVDHVQMFFE
jgi:hypothetical protein